MRRHFFKVFLRTQQSVENVEVRLKVDHFANVSSVEVNDFTCNHFVLTQEISKTHFAIVFTSSKAESNSKKATTLLRLVVVMFVP